MSWDLFLNSSLVSIYITRFNIDKFYVLPTHCIYVFSVYLRANGDCIRIQP